MHFINLPLLFAVMSLITNTVAARGSDHVALLGEPRLVRSLTPAKGDDQGAEKR